MRPKWFFGRCAKNWMKNRYEPDFKEIYASNLNVEIDLKYKEDSLNNT